MLAASCKELEDILKECNEFVFSLAVSEEEGEEYGEVASPHDYFLCDFLCYFGCGACVLGKIMKATYTLK